MPPTRPATISSHEDLMQQHLRDEKRMIQEFGIIDILVNNAGLQKDAPIERMTLADWRYVLDVNLTGQFLCAREAIREFKRRGIRQEAPAPPGRSTA